MIAAQVMPVDQWFSCLRCNALVNKFPDVPSTNGWHLCRPCYNEHRRARRAARKTAAPAPSVETSDTNVPLFPIEDGSALPGTLYLVNLTGDLPPQRPDGDYGNWGYTERRLNLLQRFLRWLASL